MKRRVSQLLRIPESKINDHRLRCAIRSATTKDQTYWDALANNDQLDGNIPFECCVAMCYHDVVIPPQPRYRTNYGILWWFA